jgi:hypothetical protein
MMSKDGGPAFPIQYVEKIRDDWWSGQMHEHVLEYGGMSLRDYFAAQALSGVIGQYLDLVPRGKPQRALDMSCNSLDADICGDFANAAYRLADAMLKAREANHG